MTSSTLTYVVYGVILGTTVLWALVAARRDGWMDLPQVLDAATRRRGVRVAVVVGWVWLGWHLFARGSGAFE